MNDPDSDYTIAWSGGLGNELPDRLWLRDDFPPADEYPAADPTGGLTSLAFIAAAIRRRARFWSATAAIGFLIACGFYVKSPPAYQAAASLLLTSGPYENITTAQNNDVAFAQSRAVAALAVQRLGLRENAGNFLATYAATSITERVLRITATAPSFEQAEAHANAVAAAFLQFRAQEMRAEQKLVLASLDQQLSEAQQNISSLNARISQVSAQPSSAAQQSQLKSLRAERAQVASTVYNLQQAVMGGLTGVEPATAAAVKGSVVLDAAAPLPRSRLKPLIRGAAIGLIGGLAIGMAIVVIQALASDKLRRRDDIARALGAPVKLSVRAARPNRWLSGRIGRSADGEADVQRVAAHLGRAVPGSSRDAAALAVVPVDDPEIAAMSLVSLAVSCARKGQKVVVADLCRGAPAARLLGAADPGIRAVTAHDARLVVAVPEPDDVVPVGPLGGGANGQRSSFTTAVAAACAPANLLLTLVSLDPSVGGEHLATWATDAVAVVTAGRSSWTKIHTVGEMVRLSDVRLVSAVLAGADSTDESLGLTYTPETV